MYSSEKENSRRASALGKRSQIIKEKQQSIIRGNQEANNKLGYQIQFCEKPTIDLEFYKKRIRKTLLKYPGIIVSQQLLNHLGDKNQNTVPLLEPCTTPFPEIRVYEEPTPGLINEEQ